MFSSYKPEDVTILLKDISGLVTPLGTKEREACIQSGIHYSEMLPLEYEPSADYLESYHRALALYAGVTARAVASVSAQIWREKGENAALVSLARAGTSIGVLIRRFILRHYGAALPHYTVSIIRGRGIDKNAMDYILARHRPADIQFIDGWTGKGAIRRQLDEAVADYPGVEAGLAVLSDPARAAKFCGTRNDFLIASSCLNSTVSGLLSRTFYRPDIIGAADFHGALFYKELLPQDLTCQFIEAVEAQFPAEIPEREAADEKGHADGLAEARAICEHFGITDINFVKPGIGEATRVLLRRVPWKLLVHSLDDEEHLGHLYQLARERAVPLEEYSLRNYRACGLIKTLADT